LNFESLIFFTNAVYGKQICAKFPQYKYL